jgi:hypothetical protein
MSNLRTEHQTEIDKIHDRQLAERDAAIERLLLKHAKEQNVLLTSLEAAVAKIEQQQALLSECVDALSNNIPPGLGKSEWDLVQRAREATRK